MTFRFSFGLLIFFLMFVPNLSVQAQTYIYEDPFLQAENSIVRNYKDGVDITYTLGWQKVCFNYVDRNTNLVSSVDVYGQFVVFDFRILNDTVFFCGEHFNRGVFGYFDINDVFFSSGSIKYVLFNYASGQSFGVVSSLFRIAVTQTVVGETHMVMTGLRYADINNTKVFSHVGAIVDAWIGAAGSISYSYILDENDKYRFDDVTITNNYAVVTAFGIDESTHNILYYPKPTISGGNFFGISTGTVYTPMWTADQSVFTVHIFAAIRIAPLKKDGFATSCLSSDSTIVVSEYSTPTQQAIRRFYIPNYDICKEMVYNSRQDALYILPELKNYLYRTVAPYTITTKVTSKIVERWLSIDNADNNKHEILTGYDHPDPMKKIWQFDFLDYNRCVGKDDYKNVDMQIVETNSMLEQEVKRPEVEYSVYTPESEKSQIDIICAP